ncbi:hypothetical protein GCM10010449_54460 [Streptomyces rectiviolaceus]|uniref:Uncharacterized protein n=1 Tax=Streptomyces rectiviolaceus TaxID=332591 RepID=A0ABP6MU52_9ACTN
MAELGEQAVAARDQAARARIRLGWLIRHHLGGLGVRRRGRRRRGGLVRPHGLMRPRGVMGRLLLLRMRLLRMRRLRMRRLLLRLLGVRVAVLAVLPTTLSPLPGYAGLWRLESETGGFVRAVGGSPVITHAHISTLPTASRSTRVTDL